MKQLTIATRGSRLALWQAEHIKSFLEKEHGFSVQLLVLKTKGDVILDVPLSKVGGKGLFVKEIEEALLDGRADLAVHSMKDVPMLLPDGLVLGAVPEREAPDDLLLSRRWPTLNDLPPGAKVGTSSLRRQAQILALRPDVRVVSLRGNVDTRLRKLLEDEFDAVVMAAAGMRRLGLSAPYMFPLSAPDFLPAAGQGALGIEFCRDRHDLFAAFAPLNHEPTRVCVTAERAFLAGLEGGCQVPIAALASLVDTSECVAGTPYAATDSRVDAMAAGVTPETPMRLEGLVADVTGRRIIRKHLFGAAGKAADLGHALAETVKIAGGANILHELYEADPS